MLVGGGDVLVFGPRGDHALDLFGVAALPGRRGPNYPSRTARNGPGWRGQCVLANQHRRTCSVRPSPSGWPQAEAPDFAISGRVCSPVVPVAGGIRRRSQSLAERLTQESRHPLLAAAVDQVRLWQGLGFPHQKQSAELLAQRASSPCLALCRALLRVRDRQANCSPASAARVVGSAAWH